MSMRNRPSPPQTISQNIKYVSCNSIEEEDEEGITVNPMQIADTIVDFGTAQVFSYEPEEDILLRDISSSHIAMTDV